MPPPLTVVPQAMGACKAIPRARARQRMKKARIIPLRFLKPIRAQGRNAARAMPALCQRPTGVAVDDVLFATPVVTVTVAYPVTPLATGSVAGFKVHAAFCGTPVHPMVSVPADPFTGITWIAKVAVCPLTITAEGEPVTRI